MSGGTGLPATHSGRPSSVCLTCHQLAPNVLAAVTASPAAIATTAALDAAAAGEQATGAAAEAAAPERPQDDPGSAIAETEAAAPETPASSVEQSRDSPQTAVQAAPSLLPQTGGPVPLVVTALLAGTSVLSGIGFKLFRK